jgi:hypothetical protein
MAWLLPSPVLVTPAGPRRGGRPDRQGIKDVDMCLRHSHVELQLIALAWREVKAEERAAARLPRGQVPRRLLSRGIQAQPKPGRFETVDTTKTGGEQAVELGDPQRLLAGRQRAGLWRPISGLVEG